MTPLGSGAEPGTSVTIEGDPAGVPCVSGTSVTIEGDLAGVWCGPGAIQDGSAQGGVAAKKKVGAFAR